MKYIRAQFYLPVFVLKKMQEYCEDGLSELGMKKTLLLGKLIEKAIDSDLLGVYKPASERASEKPPKPPKAAKPVERPAPKAEAPAPEEDKFAEQRAALHRLMEQFAIAHKAGDTEAMERIAAEGRAIKATMVS